MDKKKILVGVSNYKKNCPKARQMLLDKGYELIELDREDPYTKEELMQISGDIDGVIAGMEPWCEEVFQTAPKLKVVARFGVGFDTVDLDAAKKHGVIACNVRSFMLSNSVAEYALTLMLTAMKNIIPMDKVMHENKWDRFTGNQLYGKTVGIMGFGAIGQCFARTIQGFNVKILAYDPFPNEKAAKELNVTFASKEEVLKQCDCITLHIPNTPENYHFIDKAELDIMKDGVVIVNTARGPAWNLDAVYEAVKSGKVGAAGVDVYEQEPPEKDMPILQCPNVVFQPHSSSETWESKEAVSMDCAQCVIDALEGRIPKTALNV
ncbi:phosphoglycerate dehydrogenase [Qiania dongpingensis]|uniref:Phosphoglycerate dehydrogenase n=1 Tax=Qiania dongpingensis TaxID=2763669 RepID=A0A7G9G7A0_9FIRM|nr:phosphoglycerate dehydrogenase [Qiania dongpingensis]QNM06682.1 phosphoglycerate dehydrogenase [Qiania dongpingensis]